MKTELKTFTQIDAYSSPWSLRRRVALFLWEYVWALTCFWTPKPLNFWRLIVLQCFGAQVHGRPFVHSRARIQHPWNLVLHHRACLGDRANAYCLDRIELHAGCTIAQEAYLCTGTHDFKQPHIPLQTAPIVVGEEAFVGARAFLLPGVTVGRRSVIGAAAVITRNVEDGGTMVGNPARRL